MASATPETSRRLVSFGDEHGGFIWGWIAAAATTPAANCITHRAHGAFAEFSQGRPGGITDPGPEMGSRLVYITYEGNDV